MQIFLPHFVMFQNFKHQIACMTLRIHQKHAISGDFFLVKGPGPSPRGGTSSSHLTSRPNQAFSVSVPASPIIILATFNACEYDDTATFARHCAGVVPRPRSTLAGVAFGFSVELTFRAARRTFCKQQVLAKLLVVLSCCSACSPPRPWTRA